MDPEQKKRGYIHHEIHNQNTFKAKILHSLREIVFGLQDGIVSTLGAVTGIAAGVQNTSVVILSGFVIIVVESLSMAAGTFLSSKSEHEAKQRMLDEEAQEIEDFPEAETEELREFYEERGFSKEEIRILVKRITGDKKLWLEEMAFKELGVIPGSPPHEMRAAIFMGISYIIGGLVSIASYFFFPVSIAIPVSIGFSIIVLFGVGYAKGTLVKNKPVRSGLEMTLVSLAATALGYFVGRIMSYYFGI